MLRLTNYAPKRGCDTCRTPHGNPSYHRNYWDTKTAFHCYDCNELFAYDWRWEHTEDVRSASMHRSDKDQPAGTCKLMKPFNCTVCDAETDRTKYAEQTYKVYDGAEVTFDICMACAKHTTVEPIVHTGRKGWRFVPLGMWGLWASIPLFHYFAYGAITGIEPGVLSYAFDAAIPLYFARNWKEKV